MAVSVRRGERFAVAGPVGNIEVSLHRGEQSGACFHLGLASIICHPHPLYGGTMDNKVVTALVRSHTELGIDAVRFNFRGVGGSEGSHTKGRGEVEDLLAILAWLRGQMAIKGVFLAGFSFGSYVAATASHKVDDIVHLALVAPPVEHYVFDREGRFPCPVCVVMGDQDELVEAREVYHWLEGLHQPGELIKFPQATHFFHGHLTQLRVELQQTMLRQLDF